MKTMIKSALFAAILGLMGQGLMLEAGIFSKIQREQQWDTESRVKQILERELTREEIRQFAEREKNEKTEASLMGAYVASCTIALGYLFKPAIQSFFCCCK